MNCPDKDFIDFIDVSLVRLNAFVEMHRMESWI